jgi:predicted dehydrogenase
MDIIGTKGRAVVEGNTIRLSKSELDSREYARTASETAGEHFPRTYEEIEFAAMSNSEAYIQMLQNFTDAVINGAELIADGKEGEKALEIANAAYLSASSQKEIAFPIDEDQYDAFLQAMIEKEKK